MLNEEFKATGIALAKGTGAAIGLTLIAMALLAALIMLVTVSDGVLLIVNQLVKAGCVFFGAKTAVGLGGRRGFAMGAAVGLLYMILGYALVTILGGAPVNPMLMTGEFVMGAGIGALSGALVANLKPRKKRGRLRVKNQKI